MKRLTSRCGFNDIMAEIFDHIHRTHENKQIIINDKHAQARRM